MKSKGLIYFRGCTAQQGCEIWQSNGTTNGTKLLKEIEPGTQSGGFSFLAKTPDKLYFTACQSTTGCELWVTDGTSNGTSLIKDINPGAGNGNGFAAFTIGDRVLFRACPTESNCQLWQTDGTLSTTSLVKNIDFSFLGNGSLGTLWKNEFYFRGCDTTPTGNICRLWKTDGTSKGTVLVKDVALNGARGGLPVIESITRYGRQLFFSANNSVNGTELWKTDGTSVGTVQVKDINPGAESSFPSQLTVLNGKLCFSAQDPAFGDELRATDGTEAGTVLVKDINPGSAGSFATVLASFGGYTYFQARSPQILLWRSNCTEAGTSQVSNVEPDVPNAPRVKTAVVINNDRLYFIGKTPQVKVGLWRTDGTTTTLVNGTFSSAQALGDGDIIEELVKVQNNLFFKVGYLNPFGVYSYELWKTDGLTGATARVYPN